MLVAAPATTDTDLWTFPSDLGLRRRLFHPSVFAHPAKLNLGLLQRLIDLYTAPGETILDPMAGTGSLMLAATQARNVILRDLVHEYVHLIELSLPRIRQYAGLFAGLIDVGQGDARTLNKFKCPRPDHILFSPPYGFEVTNGAANKARALQLSGRGKKLGRRWQRFIEQPTHASFAAGFRYAGGTENTGNKSGRNYWADMEAIYARCAALLSAIGYLILVIKNHYRRGVLRDVTGQTVALVEGLGVPLVARHGRRIENPSLWQRRRKEQGLPIVEVEDVLVFRKGAVI